MALNDRIRIGPSPIHGRGVFAKTALSRGARVIEYLGEKITKVESARRCERQNWCIFSLDGEFDLDGNFAWNPCEGGRIWITAVRDIQPGEEITFNYGYDWEAYQEHPCRCGAAECLGYIVAEEFFGQLRRQRIFKSPPPDVGQSTAPSRVNRPAA
jgi:uncharacterized protein